jgi:hypothetical protein
MSIKTHWHAVKDKFTNKLASRYLFVLEQDGFLYRIVPTGYERCNDHNLPRGAVLILTKGCYQQSQQSLAIRPVRDIRNMLALQEPDKSARHFIGPWLQGKRDVTSVRINPQFSELCQQATFVLPASLLLAHALTPGAYEIRLPDSTLYALKSSGATFNSVQQSGLVANTQKAGLMLGVAPDTELQELAPAQSGNLLRQAILSWPAAWWWTSRSIKAATVSALPLKLIAISAGVAFLGYQLVATLYLSVALSQAQARLDTLGPEVNQRLTQRSQLDRQLQEFQLLQANHANPQSATLFWNVLAELALQNVQLTSATFDSVEHLTLTAEADSATEVLALILASPFVSTADFTSPVRRVRQREQFSVRIQLNPNAVIAEVTNEQ